MFVNSSNPGFCLKNSVIIYNNNGDAINFTVVRIQLDKAPTQRSVTIAPAVFNEKSHDYVAASIIVIIVIHIIFITRIGKKLWY